MKMVGSSFGVFDPLSFNLNEDELQWEHNVLPLEFWLQVWTSLERHFGISAVFGMRCDIELSHTRHRSQSIFQTLERRSPFRLKACGSFASLCIFVCVCVKCTYMPHLSHWVHYLQTWYCNYNIFYSERLIYHHSNELTMVDHRN